MIDIDDNLIIESLDLISWSIEKATHLFWVPLFECGLGPARPANQCTTAYEVDFYKFDNLINSSFKGPWTLFWMSLGA